MTLFISYLLRRSYYTLSLKITFNLKTSFVNNLFACSLHILEVVNMLFYFCRSTLLHYLHLFRVKHFA